MLQATKTYSVSTWPGDSLSRDLVIAFGGAQAQLGGIQVHEFSNSLGAQALKRHVVFVREQPSRWYNTIDTALVEALTSAREGRQLFTLGNSMGGFAAILFSLLLPGPCRSISFCPQFSIHRNEVPFEERWADYASAIAPWRFRTCLPDAWNRPKGVSHFIFCGGQAASDVRHVERIVATAANEVIAFVVDGCGHDIARFLKSHDLLAPLLNELIGGPGRPIAIAAALDGRRIRFRTLGASEVAPSPRTSSR